MSLAFPLFSLQLAASSVLIHLGNCRISYRVSLPGTTQPHISLLRSDLTQRNFTRSTQIIRFGVRNYWKIRSIKMKNLELERWLSG